MDIDEADGLVPFLTLFTSSGKKPLINQRILQKRRHEIDLQRSEVHEKLLGDIKFSVYRPEEVVLLLKNQTMPNIHETQKATSKEGEGCKDLELRYQSSTQSKSMSTGSKWKTVGGKQNNIIFRLRTPWWFSFGGLCFDVFMRKSLFEGGIGYRAYRVVSPDAPIIKYAKNGNITAIQEMFSNGIASPNDRTTDGWTVLGVRLCVIYTFKG